MKKLSSHPATRLLTNAMCSLLMIVSCDDDKPEILPAVIQFSTNLQNIAEGEETTVLLTLDRPAPNNGSVKLDLATNAVYNQHFETDPLVNNNTIVLAVRKGQTSVELKISTVNNDKYEGTRFIVFQLTSQTDELRPGEITALTLAIGDDEGPSLANFNAASATIHETDVDGILVQIPFTAPARGEGSVTVTIQAGMAIHGTNFIVDQNITGNTFSFNVVRNTTGVSFKVFPVNNDLFTGDLPLAFSITEISGVVQKGNNLKYNLTIKDDEQPSFARFALSSSSVAETQSEGIVIDVLLSSPVKGDGKITIRFPSADMIYGTDFTTLPEASFSGISLEVSHNQTSASFAVFPLNNNVLNEDRTLTFSITSASGPVWRATDSLIHNLTFVDDEIPSFATFALTSAEVLETNSNAMEVEIVFSDPVLESGRIIVDVAGYMQNFTSEPPLTEVWHYESYSGYITYHIELDVPVNATRASFKIMPINNDHCNEGEGATFTIGDVSGSIRKEGEPALDLMIVDDEDPARITLAETEGTLNENDTAGKEIVLNFSKPAVTSGTIWVYLNYYNQLYTGRYRTVPSMTYLSGVGDGVSLNFQPGHTSVRLMIFAVNDNLAREDVIEPFHIAVFASTPSDDHCMRIVDDTYTLTFVDDD